MTIPRSLPSHPTFSCRSCGSAECRAVVSFGRTPLANALRRAQELDAPEPTFPLDLVVCGACRLVQITQTVPPDALFREYPYFSSVSDALVEHARQLAQRIIEARGLDRTSLVVEVASNDGYLLQHYQRAGVRVLGIDPAYNVARVAIARGIPTLTEFFGRELAERLAAEHGTAQVIHAHNVLAHVPDPNGFLSGMARLLGDDGVAIIEVPYLRDLIDQHEFDTIYHEHLSYFSLTALMPLLHRNGLIMTRVERIAIHGGSLRLFVQRPPARVTSTVEALLDEEDRWGIHDWHPYARFAESALTVRRALITLLDELRGRGNRIAAYGAAAKGSSLLNFCHIGMETLDFVVDLSPNKQGHYLPGSGLPIHAPEKLLEVMPDYVLLLTWNFADEVFTQQAEYLRRGGRFIVPIPMPAVRP